ncbi:fimbria/pilus periplasmic chaperone [Pantoea agglomerans]|nr:MULTISPECIES: fimbria/pilus periplasmic chaperone [Pantoea]UIL53204.1 fimbria/pilus periplasmic chaperone [Pantoea agglomerans]
MMNIKILSSLMAGLLLGCAVMPQANAAIALDRTRVIFDGGKNSTSLNISNKNKELPYLAQGWIEDANGNKIDSPLIVLPPLQRLDPSAKSQVKIQSLPAINLLAQDKETLYYFNLREIPPRTNKANTLQIALQTRIKLFYRPATLIKTSAEMINVWKDKITLTREGNKYRINNNTPYFFNVAAVGNGSKDLAEIKPLTIAPQSSETLSVSADQMGNSPDITFINDYGGRPKLHFRCSGSTCNVGEYKEG